MSVAEDLYRKAVSDAGIYGQNREGGKAVDDFAQYYIAHWPQWQRSLDGYKGVYKKARAWWLEHWFRYDD